MPVPLALLLALSTSIRAILLVLTGRYLSSIAQKAHFKRQLEIKGRILPFAWMPVPLALPTPLIAALRALKVGVPFLQRCHTLTVWLRALHQAPISAVHTQSLLHCQKADSSVMPSQGACFLSGTCKTGAAQLMLQRYSRWLYIYCWTSATLIKQERTAW